MNSSKNTKKPNKNNRPPKNNARVSRFVQIMITPPVPCLSISPVYPSLSELFLHRCLLFRFLVVSPFFSPCS